MESGEEMIVHTDNETSLKNLVTFLEDQGSEPEVISEGSSHTIKTAWTAKGELEVDPQKYCDNDPANKDYVVCIKGELMGEGDPELGKILMETFLDNLKLQGQLPACCTETCL